MKTYIYAIKNLINNKMYIGSTKSIDRRKYQHFFLLKNNKHFSPYLQHAYNKYGKDKFAFYILEECDSKSRTKREVYYIKKYKSHIPKYGYNTYEPNEDNFKCSEQTKIKIQNANKCISIDAYKIDGTFIGSFPSARMCGKTIFNIPNNAHRNILRIVEKKAKQYKGYVFVKAGEPFSYIPSKFQRDMSKFYK